MTKKTWSILPKTTPGKWSLGLIIAMPLLFITGSMFFNTVYQSVPSGKTLFEDIVLRPGLALSMLAAMGCGISAFITGILAIIRKKERALLVYVSCGIGALVIVVLATVMLFPE
jgi:hypothetical protein